jgi:methylated-DNA-[protein]-cysteine S-methyltransferase
MRFIRRREAAVGITHSPFGPLLVAVGPNGLLMVRYLHVQSTSGGIAILRLKFDPVEDERVAEQVGDQIRRFLAGQHDALGYRADLSLVAGEFQRRALEQLAEVPCGAIVTYHALAATIGAPNAQRAVGSAMAANPIPIYVPCHRVVRSDGVIGHYGGGTRCKVELLRAEGFAIDKSLKIPADAVCGHRQTRIFCRTDCAAARRADPARMLIFASPRSALEAGMRACKLCHPT